VWFAMGCHPKMATGFNAGALAGLKKCLDHPKCVALGEIGLDYSGRYGTNTFLLWFCFCIYLRGFDLDPIIHKN